MTLNELLSLKDLAGFLYGLSLCVNEKVSTGLLDQCERLDAIIEKYAKEN